MADSQFTIILFALFVLLVLELSGIVILARVFADKTVSKVGKILQEQSARETALLEQSVQAGTDAAKAAYQIANHVNEKFVELHKKLDSHLSRGVDTK